jgi:DNA-binding response OmpR family regulator
LTERIVIVDDDVGVRRVVERLLTAQGYEVSALGTAAELRARLAANPPDLIVLDLDLGGEDGLALAREVRARCTLPILMLTGHDTTFDKVAGLEAGADDYLTKPFDGHELVARIRALRRRTQVVAAQTVTGVLRFAGWRLHEAERELIAPSGARVDLTAHEFQLVAALARSAGAPVDRDALNRALHGRVARPGDRSLDVRMTRLRRKLAEHGGAALIKTLRGKGYVLAAIVAADGG